MSKLSDFGGGILPEKTDPPGAPDTRSERAKHRRRTYRLGRCRAISTSKGCRCGGAVIEETDGPLCYYHGQVADSPAPSLPTIDSSPDLVAQWCGTRPAMWDELPTACRAALRAMEVRRYD